MCSRIHANINNFPDPHCYEELPQFSTSITDYHETQVLFITTINDFVFEERRRNFGARSLNEQIQIIRRDTSEIMKNSDHNLRLEGFKEIFNTIKIVNNINDQNTLCMEFIKTIKSLLPVSQYINHYVSVVDAILQTEMEDKNIFFDLHVVIASQIDCLTMDKRESRYIALLAVVPQVEIYKRPFLLLTLAEAIQHLPRDKQAEAYRAILNHIEQIGRENNISDLPLEKLYFYKYRRWINGIFRSTTKVLESIWRNHENPEAENADWANLAECAACIDRILRIDKDHPSSLGKVVDRALRARQQHTLLRGNEVQESEPEEIILLEGRGGEAWGQPFLIY